MINEHDMTNKKVLQYGLVKARRFPLPVVLSKSK